MRRDNKGLRLFIYEGNKQIRLYVLPPLSIFRVVEVKTATEKPGARNAGFYSRAKAPTVDRIDGVCRIPLQKFRRTAAIC